VDLLDATLTALPDILLGRLPATQVLFPDASMRRVEGIYQRNPVADYFNEVLACCLLEHLQARFRDEPNARLQLLEIGAGTGGTSALLFERLAPLAGHIERYSYTDVSQAFRQHAREHYGTRAP
ncbi:hypothetical protein C3F00_045885, partial [Pseudomonas sp. MWU13-2860]